MSAVVVAPANGPGPPTPQGLRITIGRLGGTVKSDDRLSLHGSGPGKAADGMILG